MWRWHLVRPGRPEKPRLQSPQKSPVEPNRRACSSNRSNTECTPILPTRDKIRLKIRHRGLNDTPPKLEKPSMDRNPKRRMVPKGCIPTNKLISKHSIYVD